MLPQHHRINTREPRRADGGRLRVAYLSTYPPRECGLATFCQDLMGAATLDAAAGEPMVIAMESGACSRQYGWPVVLIVDEGRETQYEAAADFLNESGADVVSIQHEFGIFGGFEGRGLYAFLDRLRKPVVTTLHTVISDPEPQVRSLVCNLAERSHRLVVMNALGIDMLSREYGIEQSKMTLIHHGGIAPSPEARGDVKARLGLAGKRVLSTFGLVGRGKGLEYVLGALVEIRRRHPQACYVIVGQTHPGVQRVEKESYREELARLVTDLNLHDSVRFVNRYVGKAEIVRYLAATDIYITPYLNPQQITSGTLAYAVTAGKAVVSTPYAYAQFLLHEAGGVLVDFRSESAIAAAVNEILDRPDLQRTLERRSRIYGRQMLWPAVGSRYLSLFRRAVLESRAPAPARVYVAPQLSLPFAFGREHSHGPRRGRPSAIARPLTTTD